MSASRSVLPVGGGDGPGSDRDRLARVVLGRVFEPGQLRVSALVGEYGAPVVLERICEQRTGGHLTDDAFSRLDAVDPERDLERAARRGIRFVVPGDEEWPASLDDLAGVEPLQRCSGAPLGLWVRGPRRLADHARALSLVGSRAATTYGIDVTLRLSAEVAARGWTVVSGLADGIDQAAHRGALSVGGCTIAVLANGVDRAYPAGSADLLDVIAQEGLVISELAPGCAPSRIRFLSRNRVIAALGRGSVIVEAALRSGALNTANWAGRLHRCVMGVPGPVTSGSSQGVHQLLRMGGATVVTSGAEALELVGASGENLPPETRGESRPRDRLTRRQQQVLEAVPMVRPATVESIARTAGIAVPEVTGVLDWLRRHGFVERMPRGWRVGEAAQETAAPTGGVAS
ncbi:DNA-processing protein DprA [Nocardioides insulae]|uniref:DNA-processing protein DprA n=1 Tax=Nocardioides insulae TaxID=394734 RepID=UPI0005624757|nr:DNA-processing protein DprA [Nocardioides insulae]